MENLLGYVVSFDKVFLYIYGELLNRLSDLGIMIILHNSCVDAYSRIPSTVFSACRKRRLKGISGRKGIRL